MKRSTSVTLTAVMLTTLAVTGCGVEDRSFEAQQYQKHQTTQTFDYAAEKQLRLTCDKPEDFSVSACHGPNAYHPTPNPVVTSTCDPTIAGCQQPVRPASTSHSSFIFIPMMFHSGGSSYSAPRYGVNTPAAQSYNNARSAYGGQGLSGAYRAAAIPANVSRFGSVGANMARSSVSTIARGGFGGTGRGFAAGAAHGMSVSAGA